MDLTDVFVKLDKMNEHISVLRENSARMGAVLEENTRDVRVHIRRSELLEAKVAMVEKEHSKWKGVVLTVGAILTALVTFLSKYLGKT